MSSSLLPQHTQKSGDDNLIPLINIVFLLLIFFMIAGQISNTQNDTVDPPVSNSDKPISRETMVLALESDNTLTLDGEIISLEVLPERLTRRTGDTTPPTISVKADKALKASDLDRLFDVLRAQGITTITLYTKQAEGL